MVLKKLAQDIYGRVFYASRLDAVSDFISPFPGHDYVCMVWNHQPIAATKADMLGRALIQSGCRYIVTAGRNARVLENAFDRAYVHLQQAGELQDGDFVMTAAFQDEPVEDSIQFFAHATNYDNHDFAHFLMLFLDIPKKERFNLARIMARSVILF